MVADEEEGEVDLEVARDLATVKGFAAQIAEHFDTVQIFCTKKVPDGTNVHTWGDGNWYARYGQIKEWVIYTESQFKPDN